MRPVVCFRVLVSTYYTILTVLLVNIRLFTSVVEAAVFKRLERH